MCTKIRKSLCFIYENMSANIPIWNVEFSIIWNRAIHFLCLTYENICSNFPREILNIVCITWENLGANFPTCNLEYCIFKISIKRCIPILLHKIWNSVYFRHENHCDSFTHRYFSGTLLLFPWSIGCWQFDLWFLCNYWNDLLMQ